MSKPWIEDNLPQKDSTQPGVQDLYKSPNVFINNVPVVLYATPSGQATPESVTVSLTVEQLQAVQESAARATSSEEVEAGLFKVGEVPQDGSPSTFPEITGTDTFSKLASLIQGSLNEAKAGLWQENGSNGKILNCYKTVGFNVTSDNVPWCAAFAGTMLKTVGAGGLRTLSSLAYQGFGQSVPLNDKSAWRLNDIVVFSRKGGGHIGFFRGYNPSNGSVLIAGGNQSNTLKESAFKSSMPIVYVGRNWTIPAEFDRTVTFTGSGSNVTVL